MTHKSPNLDMAPLPACDHVMPPSPRAGLSSHISPIWSTAPGTQLC